MCLSGCVSLCVCVCEYLWYTLMQNANFAKHNPEGAKYNKMEKMPAKRGGN